MTRPLTPNVDAAAGSASAALRCEGCGKGLTPAEGAHWRVCLDCTKARHRTAVNRGRCGCRAKDKRPGEVVRQGPRAWIPCRRCLGAIKEVTP